MEASVEHPSGTVTWLDLSTTDIRDAAGFYHELLGWALVAERTRAGLHVVGEVDHHAVAGMMDSVEFEGGGGVARWTVFFRVERLEDSIGVVVSEGGAVRLGPIQSGEDVRVALIEDPSGAVFGMIEQTPDRGIEAVDRAGGFVAAELHTDDLEVADFYKAVFNWVVVREGDGDSLIFERSGQSVAGLVADSPLVLTSPRWVAYFEVDDVDEALQRTEWLGGSVLAVTTDDDTPCAIIRDPEGAVLGICHH